MTVKEMLKKLKKVKNIWIKEFFNGEEYLFLEEKKDLLKNYGNLLVGECYSKDNENFVITIL